MLYGRTCPHTPATALRRNVIIRAGGRAEAARDASSSRRGVRLPFSELGGVDSREHIVVGRGLGDDTVDGLCARYGLLPHELQAANPGVVRHSQQVFRPGTKVLVLAPDMQQQLGYTAQRGSRRAAGARGGRQLATVEEVSAPVTERRRGVAHGQLDTLISAAVLAVAALGLATSVARQVGLLNSGGQGESPTAAVFTPRSTGLSGQRASLPLPQPRFIPSWRAAEAMTAGAAGGRRTQAAVETPQATAPPTFALVRISDAEMHWRREARENVARAVDAGVSPHAAWNLIVASACAFAASAYAAARLAEQTARNVAAWMALHALRVADLLRRGLAFVVVDGGTADVEQPLPFRAAEALQAARRARQQQGQSDDSYRRTRSTGRRRPGPQSGRGTGRSGGFTRSSREQR
jgi:hypothetical protein